MGRGRTRIRRGVGCQPEPPASLSTGGGQREKPVEMGRESER